MKKSLHQKWLRAGPSKAFGSTSKSLIRRGPTRKSRGTSTHCTPSPRTSTFRYFCRSARRLYRSLKWQSITKTTWRRSKTSKVPQLRQPHHHARVGPLFLNLLQLVDWLDGPREGQGFLQIRPSYHQLHQRRCRSVAATRFAADHPHNWV